MKPHLYEGGIEPADLCQGAVGDCWLVAALACAAEHPAAIRNAAERLSVGDVSPAIAIEGGYAVIKLEEILAARATRDAESILLEDARADQERVLMTALARRLLNESSLTIFDPALETAWRRRGNQ